MDTKHKPEMISYAASRASHNNCEKWTTPFPTAHLTDSSADFILDSAAVKSDGFLSVTWIFKICCESG